MTQRQEKGVSGDIPTQVFTEFLTALREASISPDIVARLLTALLEDRTFTERGLKAAVLSEESLS